MRFRLAQLAPRWMTFDDLALYKFEFSENFARFPRFRTDQQRKEWRYTSIVSDNHCTCKHVELEQFLACFCVARVFSDNWAFLYVSGPKFFNFFVQCGRGCSCFLNVDPVRRYLRSKLKGIRHHVEFWTFFAFPNFVGGGPSKSCT